MNGNPSNQPFKWGRLVVENRLATVDVQGGLPDEEAMTAIAIWRPGRHNPD
jgi:hypothetical protein